MLGYKKRESVREIYWERKKVEWIGVILLWI